MKLTKAFIVALGAFALSGGWALAQDSNAGESADAGESALTMTLIPEDAQQPDVVTGNIELPRDEEGEYIPSKEGVENSRFGLDTANAAREDGRTFGEDMAAAAQENAENLGRGLNLEDLLPDQVPDLDQIPDTPDAPEPPTPPGAP